MPHLPTMQDALQQTKPVILSRNFKNLSPALEGLPPSFPLAMQPHPSIYYLRLSAADRVQSAEEQNSCRRKKGAQMGSKKLCKFSMNETNVTGSLHCSSKSSTGRRSFGNVVEELNPYLMINQEGSSSFTRRKVMVVVDSSREAKSALIWALTHALLKDDLLILLHFVSMPPAASPLTANGSESPYPSLTLSQEKNHAKPSDSAAINSLKALCLQRKPEIEVEVVTTGGQEKGRTIVRQAKKRGVSLLVLGQPKSLSLLTRLPLMCSDGKICRNSMKESSAMVEYCIENSECMAVGVRRKSRRVGGYVISTKRHKNFWLLA